MPGIEARAGDARDMGEAGLDLRAKRLRVALFVGVEVRAHAGGDGEAGRHRQAEVRHLGKIGALAAEQVAHA
jgi:hypothetical protein